MAPLLQSKCAKNIYAGSVCLRALVTLAVAIVAFVVVWVWALNPNNTPLTLTRPCFDVPGFGNLAPVNCQVLLLKPEVAELESAVLKPLPSPRHHFPPMPPLEAECSTASETVASIVGDTVTLADCVHARELTLNRMVSTFTTGAQRHCRRTQCLLERGIAATWTLEPLSDASLDCQVMCPTQRQGYLDTVMLKEPSGALTQTLARHCGGEFQIDGMTFQMTPRELATFDRFEWDTGMTWLFTVAILIWVLLRILMTFLAYEKQVGFDRDGLLFTRVPALRVLVEQVNDRFNGWLSKARAVWLTATTDALLTPLTTLKLHDYCAQVVTFNIPGLVQYYWVIGIMCYTFLIWVVLIGSVLLPRLNDVAVYVFRFACVPFLVAGILAKIVDFNSSGFSASMFLGVDPALAFDFGATEPTAISVGFSAMRVLLFVLSIWDLSEDIETTTLDFYLESNPAQDSREGRITEQHPQGPQQGSI